MEENMTIKKTTVWKIVSAVLGILLVVSIITGGFSGKSSSAPTGAAVAVNDIITVSAKDYVDDDPVLGNSNAPLTIVEFSDFQCPYCGRFFEETFPLIKERYIDTGKVKLVYRDFPLNFHPMAMPSALAAECANEQGKFWEFHDMIFENQEILSNDILKQFAVDLGLNVEGFNGCFASQKYSKEIANDLQDVARAGGRGTPYFIVGDIPVSGAQPFSVFQQAIESQL